MSHPSQGPWNPTDRPEGPRTKGSRQGGADKHRTVRRPWSQDNSVTEQARALAVADKFDDAAAMLRPYLRSEPTDVEARLVLAWSLIGGKDYESALAELETVRPLAPGHPQRLHLLAVASSLSGRHEEAVAAAGTLHELRPHDPALDTLLRSVTADAARAHRRPDHEIGDRNWARLARASIALWAVLFVTARVRLLLSGEVPTWGRATGLIGVLVTLVVWVVQLRGAPGGVLRELGAGLRRPMFAFATLTHVAAVILLGFTAFSSIHGYPAMITSAIIAAGASALAILGHFVLVFRRAAAQESGLGS